MYNVCIYSRWFHLNLQLYEKIMSLECQIFFLMFLKCAIKSHSATASILLDKERLVDLKMGVIQTINSPLLKEGAVVKRIFFRATSFLMVSENNITWLFTMGEEHVHM